MKKFKRPDRGTKEGDNQKRTSGVTPGNLRHPASLHMTRATSKSSPKVD